MLFRFHRGKVKEKPIWAAKGFIRGKEGITADKDRKYISLKRRCGTKGPVSISFEQDHITDNGWDPLYTVWDKHGDISDDEDALPHDLADSDVEDLINVDDDGVEKVYSSEEDDEVLKTS
ncbi:hypothetical protein Tco_0705985 [Tanacetum coccineum]|uniref:Transposase n=1 Tax=Tanacetum coccineum TaxID=301880 RepID=A0ABQ4Y680_9ASTR